MENIMELGNLIKKYIEKSERAWIIYDINRGEIELNSDRYTIGEKSFSEIGGAVKDVLKEVFGEYRAVPVTFNSEIYENEKFRAEVLALEFEGLARIQSYKEVISYFCYFLLYLHNSEIETFKIF